MDGIGGAARKNGNWARGLVLRAVGLGVLKERWCYMGGKARTVFDAPVDYVVIDTETTGLDTEWCEIIELAAARVLGGTVVDTFQSLVKPEGLPIPEFIEDLCGITNEMLEGERQIADVLPEFLEFVGSGPVVGHNVCFDLSFIGAVASDGQGGWEEPEAIDTMRLSRVAFPEMKHHRLHDVVERCEKLTDSHCDPGRAHRALADVLSTQFCMESLRRPLSDMFGDDIRAGHADAERRRKRDYRVSPGDLSPTVESIDDSNPFYGSNVCITGKLSSMSRNDAMQAIVNLGATPQSSVTKKTDYLIVGSFDFSANMHGEKSSKLERAEALLARQGSSTIVSEGFFTGFLD